MPRNKSEARIDFIVRRTEILRTWRSKEIQTSTRGETGQSFRNRIGIGYSVKRQLVSGSAASPGFRLSGGIAAADQGFGASAKLWLRDRSAQA